MQISPSAALLQAISRVAAPAQTAAVRPAAARAVAAPAATSADQAGRPHRLPDGATLTGTRRPAADLPRGSLLDISV